MSDFVIQAKAQNINTVTKFNRDLHNLLELLGQSDVQVLANGTTFTIYETTSDYTEAKGTVEEASPITPLTIATTAATTATIDYKKYLYYTGIESIGKMGYEIAVGSKNEQMLRDIQKSIRKQIVTTLASGTTKSESAAGSAFQQQLADTWGAMQNVTADQAGSAIYFVNPLDASKWLGTQQIPPATAFGMTYLDSFFGTIIVDGNVPQGTVYGTVSGNLNVLAADVRGIEGFNFDTDETGIIALHNGAEYSRAAVESCAYTGLCILPSIADHIVVNTVKA